MHFRDKDSPSARRVCIATASAAKFEEAVSEAGLEPQPTEAVKNLYSMQTKYTDIGITECFSVVKEKIEQISKLRN